MKIHNYVGVSFFPIVCTHSYCMNYYFVLRKTHLHLPTTNYGQSNKKYNMEYYRKSKVFTGKLAITTPKI